jgi:hypothetical protein
MERLWKTDIFMSRPDRCLVSEDIEFNRKYLEPVFRSERVPLYYEHHPMFSSTASDVSRNSNVVAVEVHLHKKPLPIVKG